VTIKSDSEKPFCEVNLSDDADEERRQRLESADRPTDVSDALGGLLRTVGPFLIPAALFAAGLVGYALLVLLGRLGLVATDENDEPESGEGWRRR